MAENSEANLKYKVQQALGISPGGWQRYLKNTAWLLGGQAVSLGLSFFIGAWIVRSLGPQDFGVFSYCLSFAGLFSLIAGLGIDGILSRDLVSQPEKRAQLLGSGLAVKAATGFLAWLLATAAAFWLLPAGSGRLVISLIALSYFFQALNVFDLLFRAQVLSRFGVQAQLVAVFAASLLKIWAVISGAGLVLLAAAYAAEILISGLLLMLSYRVRREEILPWRVDRATTAYLVRSSWPLLFTGLASFLLLRIDQVMIGYYQAPAELGLYAAGVKLTEVWYFIPGLIGAALFPAVINSRQADIRIYRRRVRYFYGLLGLIAGLIALGLTISMPLLISWLFGAEFLGARGPATIYAWSTIGWFLTSAWWLQLMAENRLRLIFFSSLAPLIINVLLNLYLIPRYGIFGAALATLIAYSSILVFIIYSQLYEDPASRH